MTAVTALTTVFNEETWIACAVDSLLGQSHIEIEVLVIDDGSTDATPDILARYADPRVRVIGRERIGRAAALAFGTSQAAGEYVAILDADDEAYPDRLLKQAAFLDLHPDIAWVGCGEERHDSRRGEISVRLYPASDSEIRVMSARCVPYPHSGVMFRRSLLKSGLNYDPSLRYLIDFEFFLRVAEKHRVANLPEPLVLRRLRAESYFQSSFRPAAQNRALARLSASAVRRFKLPPWHYLYPMARSGYLFVPNGAKRELRRFAGLSERFETR